MTKSETVLKLKKEVKSFPLIKAKREGSPGSQYSLPMINLIELFDASCTRTLRFCKLKQAHKTEGI